jgi:tetratricopeptide (TPR) repeat protein
MSAEFEVEIDLFGPMRIWVHKTAQDKPEQLVIPSAKARGLLALLVQAPDMTRSRSWVRDTLWSDRARTQASASLRQEILNLARVHPALDACLIRTRKTIALDQTRVTRSDPPPGAKPAAFLEDIDVQDASFQSWLASERATFEPTPMTLNAPFLSDARSTAARRILAFKTSTPSQDPNSFLETTLSHYVGQSLGEHIMIDVIDAEAARHLPDTTWIEIHAVPRDAQNSVVRVSVRDGPRKTLIWSDLKTIPSENLLEINHANLLSYCNQLVRGVLDALALRQPENAEAIETGLIAHLATRKLFSMDPTEVNTADQLLGIANERDTRGVYMAWRALVRSFQMVEKHAGDPETMRREALQYARHALELEPSNSMVLALVSNARLVMGDNVAECRALAKRAVQLNPSNPMSWDSLSIANLYLDDYQGAHDLAIRAQQVSVGTPHSFWWDMGRAVSAAAIGRLDEAIEFAEMSQAGSPLFKPPKRYLVGLYSAKGWEEKTLQAIEDLRALEPGFSPIQIAEDTSYPSSPLREGGLLNVDMLRNFS